MASSRHETGPGSRIEAKQAKELPEASKMGTSGQR